ncbi:hypothetical protein SNM59_25090, partial [Klebsiella pneumoniae]
DRNRSHWSTSKTPSYTKSVSWQHHPRQQPYSVPVLIAVSIPFDVAAAVIFAVRQKQKNLKKTICLGR